MPDSIVILFVRTTRTPDTDNKKNLYQDFALAQH